MTESNQQTAEKPPEQVALRDLIGWFIGSMTGMYLGLALGHYIQASLILFTAGIFGWVAGGIAGAQVTGRIFRTPPVRTVSTHLALGLIFGFLAGSLIGALAGFFTGQPELPSSIGGAILGMLAGRMATPAIARITEKWKKV